ncbi:WG repeat-containing protein [Myroides odoratus]|uniref:WG repeat-containing protein n=1 Tax=Myroides odoratus TaxID=256 RepID=UPI000306B793|nr:WG repeat-containing protein [Myroides odoratus]WQD56687.1 hypothetical protein U0010_14325 [Myroides odoratus]
MKHFLLLFLLTCLNTPLSAQSNDRWTAFYDQDSLHIGYKDKNGVIKIEPKFMGHTHANVFDHIIAVSEETDAGWENYYLTKEGMRVGRDSLHIFDNGADCESEGFIRFRDSKTDQVGMFNSKGDIAIPAVYSDLTRVRNGMIVGLKGAEKKYWSAGEHAACNHFSWSGGQEVLLDTLNNVLVENFSYDHTLNFYSLEKTKTPPADTNRKVFLGKDGWYYSFMDFETEFRQWLINDLFVDLTEEKLIQASYDTMMWESTEGWANTEKEAFIRANFPVLKKELLAITQPNCEYFISKDGLNPFMFEGAEFDPYFNNCREAKDWEYPTLTIVVSHRDKKKFTQNHFEFLRTNEGYKLISVTIRNEQVKG